MSASSIFTLSFVPLLMIMLNSVERRFGSARAGWLSGFPIVGAPALVILVIEHGQEFGASAAFSGLEGIVGWSVFILTFRVGPYFVQTVGARVIMVGASMLAWLGAALLTGPLRVDGPLTVGFVVYAVVVSIGFGSTSATGAKPGLSLLLTRMALAPLFVLLVVAASNVFGARAAGVLTTFPIVSSTLLYSALFRIGPEQARTLSSGMLVAGPGLACFMLFAHELLNTSASPALCLFGALVGALGVHVAMWHVVGRWSTTGRIV